MGIASGTDGLGSAIAEYDDLLADAVWSKITDTSLPSEIQGEDASLSIDAIDAPRRLVLTPHGGASETLEVAAPENTMIGEVERFRDAVRGATSPPTRTAPPARSVWSTPFCAGLSAERIHPPFPLAR